MVSFRKRDPQIVHGKHLLSAYIVMELENARAFLLNPTAKDVAKRDMMKDSGGTGATTKLVKRKVDMQGYVKAHC